MQQKRTIQIISRDAALENKRRFGMDSRMCWFVCESKEDQLQKLQTYPNTILFCDRPNQPDTVNTKAVENSTSLHEVRFVATEVPASYDGDIKTHRNKPNVKGRIREWPVRVSYLPCPCHACFIDVSNKTCKFTPWRHYKEHIMKEAINTPQNSLTIQAGEAVTCNPDDMDCST